MLLVASMIAGDHDSVREQFRRHPTRYLRRPEDLAVAVLSERTIRGLSVQALAVKADLSPRQVRRIEQADPDSVASIRRVLRVLDIEPTALPTPRDDR
jgi:ribosome-binding protein aMBF1 (putative translation factor)